MKRLIGLVILGCAVVIGFGSIAGCPKKETNKKTDIGTGSSNKETPATNKETPGTNKETPGTNKEGHDKKDAKFVVTVPGDYEVEIAKGKGDFKVTAVRENLTGEIKLKFDGIPKGVKFNYGPIAAGNDSARVDVEIDKGEAKAGTYDVTLLATHGELKQDVKMKVKLK